MPPLVKYTSYRIFLSDYLTERKTAKPALTLQRFSKMVGLSSSSLQMIIKGERNLTVHKIHAVAEAIGLNQSEHEYFELLVHSEQAESAREKRYYSARIRKTAKQTMLNVQRVSAAEVLSDWFMPTLLVYLVDRSNESDFTRIAKRFGMSLEEVESRITKLKRLGLVKTDGKNLHVAFDKLSAKFPKEQFLHRLLDEVRIRLSKEFSNPAHYFEAHTVHLSAAQYRAFVREFKTLIERFISEGDVEAQDSVIYQSFFSFFPTL